MGECQGCGSAIGSSGRYCATCERILANVDGEERHEASGAQSTKRSTGRARCADLVPTVWAWGIVLAVVVELAVLVLVGQAQPGLLEQSLLGVLIAVGVFQGWATYRDTRVTRAATSWPQLGAVHYVAASFVPILNLFVGAWYVLNRWELQHYGTTVLSVGRWGSVVRNPRRGLRMAYEGAGVVCAALLLYFLLVLLPASAVFSDVPGVEVTAAGAAYPLVIGVLAAHRYASPLRRTQQEYALRDISIRVLPILGGTVISIVLLFVLVFPVAFVLGILTTPLGDGVGGAVTLGTLYPLLLVPLAMLFVLPLRALPWLQAAPYAARQLSAELASRIETVVPIDRDDPAASDGPPILPVSGHDHTDLMLDEALSVRMDGIYGYRPEPIQEIDTSLLPSSFRRGLSLLLPGYAYAIVVFTYFQFRPERAASYAAQFPADDFLLVVLSFVGIPRPLLVEAIDAAGLPPETISLGFLGIAVPSLLMIPGAWHLALEYEGYLYRFHERLGDRNHLLLLWTLHLLLVAPIVVGYVWYRERQENRSEA